MTYAEELIAILTKARDDSDAFYSVVPGREHWWVYEELGAMINRLVNETKRAA